VNVYQVGTPHPTITPAESKAIDDLLYAAAHGSAALSIRIVRSRWGNLERDRNEGKGCA
jgi:hypothetical protein